MTRLQRLRLVRAVQYRRVHLLGLVDEQHRPVPLIAEGLANTDPADADARQAVAAGNFYVAEALAHNNAGEAAVGKFRKAFEMYRDLAGAKLIVRDPSPAGYEKALAALAAAPGELSNTIQSDLAAFAC